MVAGRRRRGRSIMTDAELDQCRHDGALLLSLVSRKVKLKREGREWKGLCPFHTEKSASFTVFSDGHYHCFGCNAHGNAFDFIMQTEDCNFPAASRARGHRAPGIAVVEADGAAGNGALTGTMWQPIVPPPADAPKPTDAELRCDVLHELLRRQRSADVLCPPHRGQGAASASNSCPLTPSALSTARAAGTLGRRRCPRPLYGLNRLALARAGCAPSCFAKARRPPTPGNGCFPTTPA